MTQLAMMFDEAPRVPDAVINDSGVLTGNLITRLYGKPRGSHVEIRLAHVGGRWSYGLSVQAGHTGSSFAPSFKWNEFSSLEEAEREAFVDASDKLHGMARKDADSCVRTGAAAMLKLLEAGQFTEQTGAT